MVVQQSAEELHQQERVALDSRRLRQQLVVGFHPEDVRRDLSHRFTLKGSQSDVFGAPLDQRSLRQLDLGKTLVRSKRHDPNHRQRSQPRRELSHRDSAGGSRPVEVIKAQQQRSAKRHLLDDRLYLLQQPEQKLW